LELDRDVEVARGNPILVELGLELLVLDRDADPAPLVDRVDRSRRIGLGDVAIEQLELQVLEAGRSSSFLASSRDLLMSLE